MTNTRRTENECTDRSSQTANEARTFRSGPYLEQLFGPGGHVEPKRQRQICERIQEARVVAGFTQQEMADLLGLTLRGYQNYEHERVPFGRLTEIAKLTAVEESWLLYGEAATRQDDLREGLATLVDLVRSVDQRLARIEKAMPALQRSQGRAGQSG